MRRVGIALGGGPVSSAGWGGDDRKCRMSMLHAVDVAVLQKEGSRRGRRRVVLPKVSVIIYIFGFVLVLARLQYNVRSFARESLFLGLEHRWSCFLLAGRNPISTHSERAPSDLA